LGYGRLDCLVWTGNGYILERLLYFFKIRISGNCNETVVFFENVFTINWMRTNYTSLLSRRVVFAYQ